ncbi:MULTISPECIES: WYL domain-containing protein [unclassified Brenneria]|uniref:WYL domain-containing protein n=1 Tax=unclassified Brenneria TaxID=2634434 RepID=UPI00155748CB|nr:WYL domain-containing protein [Brenneria sp. hezel4-2-4]MEE3651388.1 WYL domain-containing protein [Brenneria sp. HEZEL_4_2_4]NPD01342.1 WYL domain-containing protein [Brenneria sp. hezel4-2-4]
MSQTERRHERLAVRLSLIISRLVAGETLIMQKLAAEFGVSVRTLRRDFRERLTYLDLDFRDGQCSLLSGSRQRELAVQTFVRHSGVEALFPDIDNQMVTSLLSASEPPCLIWPRALARPDVFTRLVRAITEHRRVTLLAEGGRYSGLAPYRLVCSDGCWYLTGELGGHITVFPLGDIHTVTFHPALFVPDARVRNLLSHPDFLRILPHFQTFHSLLVVSDDGFSPQKEQI